MSESIKICEGLSEISDSYNGFIIDGWGTLHNGEKPYKNVLHTLQMLKDRHKQIIVLANSGQRENQFQTMLEKMGFDHGLFDHIVTSTELTWKMLNNQVNGILKNPGKKCLLLSRGENASILNDTDIEHVKTIEEADFLLVTGSDAPAKLLNNYYDTILRDASRKRLHMICANPEIKITIDGINYLGSGDIANRYAEFGGVVTYIGKPFPHIYQYAMSLFKDILPSQTVIIGDSLPQDVRGAQSIGIDSTLVATGYHSGSFKKVQNSSDIRKILKMMQQNHGTIPTYFIPRFAWGKPLPDRKNKRKKT